MSENTDTIHSTDPKVWDGQEVTVLDVEGLCLYDGTWTDSYVLDADGPGQTQHGVIPCSPVQPAPMAALPETGAATVAGTSVIAAVALLAGFGFRRLARRPTLA